MMRMLGWLWNHWKNESRTRRKPKRQQRPMRQGRRLAVESLESRTMLSGGTDDIAAALAKMTPDPHSTGDQPTDTAQVIALAAYTAPPLPPISGSSSVDTFLQGLQQIYSSISDNPQARPSFWGEVGANGGSQYTLHLCDNGMLVKTWTVNWGDGSDPQSLSVKQPWVTHAFAGNAGQYAITVTAYSTDGNFTGGMGDTPGALDTNFDGTLSQSGGPTANWASHGNPNWAQAGNSGQQTTNFNSGSGFDQAASVASDNGNILVVGTTAGKFGLVRYIDDPNSSSDGNPDTSFGTNGMVTTAFSVGTASVSAVAVDGTNSKIVVAGIVIDGNGHNEIALARYHDADGSLDTTFGTNGMVTTDLGTGWTSTNAVAIDSDGSVFVAGCMNGHFTVLHFTSGGVQDTSFGTSGIATASFGGSNETPAAMTLDSSGLILVAGNTTQTNTGRDFALARFKANGKLDTIFGSGATITTDVGGDDVATAMTIQPADGKILVAGYTEQNGGMSFALVRYNADDQGGLTLDKSFGTKGTVTTSFGDGSDRAAGVAVQSDGKIVVTGSTLLDGNANVDSVPHSALVRYLSNGTPDASFGAGTSAPAGTVTTDFTGLGFSTDSAVGMFVDANGRLIVAGTATQQDFSSFAVSCYDPGVSSLPIQVNDVAPVLLLYGSSQTTSTGQLLDVSPLGRLTHAPVATGSFSYQVDWGDGSTPDAGTATIVDPGSTTSPLVGIITGQHTYGSAGVYYGVATVTDPNGGSDAQSFQVTVNASAPAATDIPQVVESVPGDPAAPPPMYGDPSATGSEGSQGTLSAPSQGDSGLELDANSGQALTVSNESTVNFAASAPATSDNTASPLDAQTAAADTAAGVPTDPALLAAIQQALAIPAGRAITTADMARLTSLTADSNRVLSLQGLQNAVNLQSLTLVPSSFADPGHLTDLSPLAGLAQLKSLTLQRCGITDAVLSNSLTTLPNLPALQTLDLRYNGINTVPSKIAQLPGLTSLLVYGNPLTDNPRAGLAALAGRLVTVDIAPDHPENAIKKYDPTNAATAQNVYNDLADSLYDLPLAIYQYVLNTVQYQPYQGAMKGPLAVLQTGAGNDWDTDSLVVMLLQRASQQAVLQNNPATTVKYNWGQVLETLSTTQQRLAVRTAAAAYDTLNLAGLNPALYKLQGQTLVQVDPSTSSGLQSAAYAGFDHVWLQVSITGDANAYLLDPSWKLKDLQLGVPNVQNSNMLNVPALAFATDGSTGSYLSSTANANETAAEFYADKVRTWLAANDPGMTVADVAYDGPIHQQSVPVLPTKLPFVNSVSSNTPSLSIPDDYADQVRISVDIPQTGTLTCTTGTDNNGKAITTLVASQGTPFANATAGAPVVITTSPGNNQTYNIKTVQSGGTTVVVYGTASFPSGSTFSAPGFSSLQYVPSVSLERITIGYVTNPDTSLTAHLYINGTDTATSGLSTASGSNAYLVVQTIEGGYGLKYNSMNSFPRTAGADKYYAIGLDAGQISNSLLDSARKIVNDANLLKANGGTPATDALTGGLLNLAMIDFYLHSDQADQSIAALTAAMPVYNCIAVGIATADTALSDNSGQNGALQIRYLPATMGIDMPGANWNSVSIDETAITTAQAQRSYAAEDISHYALMGYTSSAEEALVWEDLTNTPSISTTKSLQMAYQPGSGDTVVLVTSANLGTVFSTSLPYGSLKDLAGTPIQTDIASFVNAGFGVLVPSELTPVNNTSQTWNGVGYFLIGNNGTGIDMGNIIDAGDGHPHGGWSGGNADPVVDIPSNFSTGDPIEISNGSVSHAETDVSIPSLGQPLSFSRAYSSDNTVGPTGNAWSDRGMGEGWSYSYSDMIVPFDSSIDGSQPANSVVWITDKGVRLVFKYNGGSYTPPATLFGTLSGNLSAGFTWTDKTHESITFTGYSIGGAMKDYVTQIADRYNNGVAINRDSATAHITYVNDLLYSSRRLTFTYTGNHITSISDFTGRTWLYGYNSAGRLTSVTAPITSTTPLVLTQYAYYPEGSVEQGLLQTVTDPDGNRTQFAYYVNRRGFQVTDATGNTQNVSHDIYRNRADVTDERGQTTSHVYDSQGNETEQINPDNTTLTYTWGSDSWNSGLKTSDTDQYGLTESFVYYSTASGGNPAGDGGNLYQYTDRAGRLNTTYTYTTYGNPLTVTNNLDGGVTTNSYNSNGSLATATDANGNVTHYWYPGTGNFLGTNRGQPVQIVSPTGNTTWYVYNSAGQTTSQYATLADHGGAPPPGISMSGSFTGTNTYVAQAWSYDPAGDLQSSTSDNGFDSSGNPLNNGFTTTYTRDVLGRALTVTQPVPDPTDANPLPAPATANVYDAAGNLISTTVVTASPQRTASTVFDSMGRAVKATSPDGTYTTVQYDRAGNVIYSTDAMGRVTQYLYDSRNRKIATTRADGSVVRIEYDGGGRVVATTDGNLNTTSYTYDQLGRKLTVTVPSPTGSGTAITQYYYDDAADKQYVTDALGSDHTDSYHTTETDYDKLGNVVKVVQPVPATGQSRPTATDIYDANGNLAYTTDPLGNTTQFVYDGLGRKTVVVPPAPNPAAIGPADGNAATLNGTNWSGPSSGGYDNTHHVFTGSGSTSASWTVTSLAPGAFYDVFVTWAGNANNTNAASYTVLDGTTGSHQGWWITGNVNQKLSPPANPIFTNACGWLSLGVFWITGNTLTVVLQNPYGGQIDADTIRVVQVNPTVSAYDANGNVTSTTNALGLATSTVYDNLNRAIETIQPDPSTGQTSQSDANCPKTCTAYNASGNVVSATEPNGNTTSYSYNVENRPTQTTDALGHTTSILYDAVGNVLGVTDALGRMTTFQYDAMDRKTVQTDPLPDSTTPSPPQTTWTYDANGNVLSTTDPLGHTAWRQYNALNQVGAATDALGAFKGDPQHTTTTTYNKLGQVLASTDQLQRTTQFVYDNLGCKIEEIDPDPGTGSPTTYYGYDADGNLKYVTDPRGSAAGDPSYTTWYFYDSLNQPICTIDPLAGLTLTTGGMAGQPPTSPTHATTTTYNAVGWVVSTTDQMGRTTNYQYDDLGRKIATIDPPPSGSTVTIDDSDPATAFVLTGPLAWTLDTSAGYDQSNHYTSTPSLSASWTDTSAVPGVQYQVLVSWVRRTANTTSASYRVFSATVNGQNWQGTLIGETDNVNQQNNPPFDPQFTDATGWLSLGYFSITGNALTVELSSTSAQLDADAVRIVPVGPTTTYSYDANGNLLSTTDPDGHSTWTVYDALNRPIKSVSADGSGPNDTHYATTTVCDAVGNTLSVTDPDGNVTSYSYDRLNRQTQITDALRNTSSVQYDADNNVVKKTDRNGRTTKYLYDPLNRQVEEDWLDANGNVYHAIQSYYDAAGQVLGVNESETNTSLHSANTSNATDYQYSYDADGRTATSRMAPGDLSQAPVVETVGGSLGSSSCTTDWNRDGTAERYQLLGYVTLSVGQTVLVQLTSADFSTAIIMLPPTGTQPDNWLIAKATNGNASWLTFTVQPGQAGDWFFVATSSLAAASGSFVMQITLDANPFVSTALTELDYTYYVNGSVHTVTDTSNATGLSGKGGTTTYCYDAVDNVAQITNQNSSGCTGITNKDVEFTYNADGSVNTIKRYNGLTNAATLVATTSYQTTTGGAGSGYDGMGRVAAIQQRYGSTPTTVSYTWQYDPASNITQEVSPDGTDSFALDNSNQLKTAGLTNESYSYDQNGNRTGGGYVTGADNRLLKDNVFSYQYDKEGNRTLRIRYTNVAATDYYTYYAYDQHNRLVDVLVKDIWGDKTSEVQYTYDFAGRVIRTATDASGTGTFSYLYSVYDGQNAYLQVSDPNRLASGGSTATIAQRDLYARAVDQILATDACNNSPTGVLWGLGDNQGTMRDVVDSSGALRNHVKFTSFGAPTSGTSVLAGFAFGKSGMRYNTTTGLYQTATVAYDPLAGRRLSEDPIGFASGTTNFTAWCGNDPTGRTDASGMCGQSVYTPPSSYFGNSTSYTVNPIAGLGLLNVASSATTYGSLLSSNPVAPESITIGSWLPGVSNDAYLHLTPASSEELASGVWRKSSWSKLGDVTSLTVPDYKANVVAPRAAGYGPGATNFAIVSPTDVGYANIEAVEVPNVANVQEYVNTVRVTPGTVAEVPRMLATGEGNLAAEAKGLSSLGAATMGGMSNVEAAVMAAQSVEGVATLALPLWADAMDNKYLKRTTTGLNSLLSQIAANDKPCPQHVAEVQQKIGELKNFSRGFGGWMQTIFTLGDSSYKEQQGQAIETYTDELAKKFGYKRTDGIMDALSGNPITYAKKDSGK